MKDFILRNLADILVAAFFAIALGLALYGLRETLLGALP